MQEHVVLMILLLSVKFPVLGLMTDLNWCSHLYLKPHNTECYLRLNVTILDTSAMTVNANGLKDGAHIHQAL